MITKKQGLKSQPYIRGYDSQCCHNHPRPTTSPFQPKKSNRSSSPYKSYNDTFRPYRTSRHAIHCRRITIYAVDASFSVLKTIIIFTTTRLLLQGSTPTCTFLLSINTTLFILLRLKTTIRRLLQGMLTFDHQISKPTFTYLLHYTKVLLLASCTQALYRRTNTSALT